MVQAPDRIDPELEEMLAGLLVGEDFVDDDYMNLKAKHLLALQYPTDIDIKDADLIIKISNILYNNTDRPLLPLDDGMYDLLMVWIQRYKEDYQVGAPPTPEIISKVAEISYDPSDKLVKPLIKLEPRKDMSSDSMIFYTEIMQERELTRDMFLQRPLYDLTPNKKKNVNTQHNYPKLVGTLDKCKFVLNQQAIDKGVYDDANVQIFERDFLQKLISSGVLDPERIFYMVLELKYDGISIEAEVSDQILEALSRGDTNNNLATDYTPVLKGYKFPKAVGQVDPSNTFGMKFEAMLGNLDLSRLAQDREKVYKNPRNATTGLFGSTDANRWRDYVTLVPLATSLEVDRLTELEFMNKYYDNGEILRYAVIKGTYKEILFQVKRFVDEAEYLRPIMPFTYDGVVCSFIEPDLIDILGRVNSVNKYQMAIKFNPQKKLTKFIGYKFTVAQNGVITPIAHYNPVELFGCTHAKTTVHSYKRFMELSLKIGDIVSIELINDVIPYINRVDVNDNEINPNPIIEFPEECPACGSPIIVSKSGKTAMCPNKECPGRALSIVVNMMDKIGFKDFSEESLKVIGTIRNLSDLINIKIDDVLCLGEQESKNFMNRLEEFLNTTMYDYRLVGALGFTNVSEERWKLILNKISIEELITNDEILRTKLLSIKGIGPNIADTIVSEIEVFYDDLVAILKLPNMVSSYGIKFGKKIRFTGCRDQELVDRLSLLGYDIKNNSSITKDTDIILVPDEGYHVDKMDKAGPDCIVVPLDDFKDNIDRYL